MRPDLIPILTHDPKSERAAIGIAPDDLMRSVYVLGKTGTGKSALLERLAVGAARAGFGVCVLDPHGELSERLLGLLPRECSERVVRLAPADERPVGLEVFAPGDGESRAFAASQLVEAFRKLWGAQLFGPRSEHLLRNAALLLLETRGATLPLLSRLLVDDAYRSALAARVTDPGVRLFWEREFPALGKKLQAEVTAPVLNKLGALTSPAVRRTLGQRRPRLRMRDALERGLVVVADLSGTGRDAAQLIGSLLVGAVASAAFARAREASGGRRPFLLVVDEAHSFVTRSLTDVLGEGRKFKLAAALAHQHLAQLPEDALAGVIGNVGNIVAFATSARDAGALSAELGGEISAKAIVRLRRHKVVARILAGGEAREPIMCSTLPPQAPSAREREKRVRQSRERYGRRAESVDREIMRSLATRPPDLTRS